MSTVRTYNPGDVVIIFGSNQISGFSEKDMIGIKPSGDGVKKYVGADGETGRSISQNDTLEITLSLAQTSKSNDILSASLEADKINGSGMKEFIMKDLSGTTLVSASQAWAVQFAEMKKGSDIEVNEWKLETGSADMFIGGND